VSWLSRRLHSRQDAGVTLVELLVSMVLVGMLGSAIAVSVSVMSRNDLNTTTRVRATEQAQVTIDRVSRVLRAAVPVDGTVFLYGDSTHVTFYADLGDPNGPEKVDLQVPSSTTNGTMVQSATRADTTSQDAHASYTYTQNTAVTSNDGTDIDTAVKGVFTYYQMSSGALTALTTPLASSAMASGGIDAVGLTLVDQEPGKSATVKDTSMIYLREAEYGSKR
jgi:prepilin-type N-terminal cleavage/methylation domain-containing protein